MKKFLLSIAFCCAATNFLHKLRIPGNLINEGKAALEAKKLPGSIYKIQYLLDTDKQSGLCYRLQLRRLCR